MSWYIPFGFVLRRGLPRRVAMFEVDEGWTPTVRYLAGSGLLGHELVFGIRGKTEDVRKRTVNSSFTELMEVGHDFATPCPKLSDSFSTHAFTLSLAALLIGTIRWCLWHATLT